ncbi:MAG TPA: class I SAM-dependent methyltransferase [Cytophagaceae bacterium]|jgi:SAM-dependent methyltransferase|nr:class I SAM-dependent methyltransferase [Cytophagaceae bacterium]
MNDKNLLFYNNIGLDPFMELSVKGGFSSYKDMEMIAPYISPDDSILELGAGFGRCLNYFIDKGHKGKLTAVEYSTSLLNYLKEKFSEKVEILDADIKKLELKEKYDVALWMWSGIIDFSAAEQLDGCRRIYDALNPKGRLFIDVPRLGVQTIANHLDTQHLVLTTEYGDIHAYIPNDQDMENVRSVIGFSRLVKLEYETTTEKKRTVYMLEKL